MKESRKTLMTKKVFREVLLELLQSKPLSKITITAICEKADLNRSTFYAHYVEVSDLLHDIENEMISNIPKVYDNNGYSGKTVKTAELEKNLQKWSWKIQNLCVLKRKNIEKEQIDQNNGRSEIMTKQTIEHYIETLKIKENRFFFGIAVSCLLDIVLAAFYFIQAVGSGDSLWHFSNTGYYILLLTGKIGLLIWGRNGDSLKGTCKAASIILILTGIFAMGRTYQYIKMDRILTFSHSVYILNGIILILRMLIYPLFQIHSKKKSSDKPEPQTNLLNPIRRGYTWAENLIAFSLLFTNLITIYGWDADNDLILSNILQGQAIGVIILATGINLLLKSTRMCNQSEPLV